MKSGTIILLALGGFVAFLLYKQYKASQGNASLAITTGANGLSNNPLLDNLPIGTPTSGLSVITPGGSSLG